MSTEYLNTEEKPGCFHSLNTIQEVQVVKRRRKSIKNFSQKPFFTFLASCDTIHKTGNAMSLTSATKLFCRTVGTFRRKCLIFKLVSYQFSWTRTQITLSTRPPPRPQKINSFLPHPPFSNSNFDQNQATNQVSQPIFVSSSCITQTVCSNISGPQIFHHNSRLPVLLSTSSQFGKILFL